jgi:hypothetical protein
MFVIPKFAVLLSVPLTYTEALLYFVTLQGTFWDDFSGYTLLTCEVAQTAHKLAAFLQNLENFSQTARRHCQTLVLPITRSRSLSFGGKHVHKVLGCDTVRSGGYVRMVCKESLQGGPVSLKMEAEIHSEIFVAIHQITRRHITESSNPGTVPYNMSADMPTLP